MDESIEALIRVNLHDFLRDKEGFTLVREESSRYPENCSSLKMRYGDTVLIVSQRDDGVWLYFNAKEPSERGTVINYLQNRNGGKASFSLGHVKRRVYGVASGGGFGGSIVPVVPRPVVHVPRDLSHVAQHWNQERTVWGLPHCLEARGITAETVTAYKSALRMDNHGNVLFAHTNQDGQIVGYEIKGHKFTGFAKGGVRLLCRLGAEVVEPVRATCGHTWRTAVVGTSTEAIRTPNVLSIIFVAA